jgi:hypothetical protein
MDNGRKVYLRTSKLKADYIKQFETYMPEIAHKYAPDIPYWFASLLPAEALINQTVNLPEICTTGRFGTEVNQLKITSI